MKGRDLPVMYSVPGSMAGRAIRYHLDAMSGARAYDLVNTGVAVDLAQRMGPITLSLKGSTRYYRHRFT
jgi:hypothetical protein